MKKNAQNLLHITAIITWGAVYFLTIYHTTYEPGSILYHVFQWGFLISYLTCYYLDDEHDGSLQSNVLLGLQIVSALGAFYLGRESVIFILFIMIAAQLPYQFRFRPSMGLLVVINVLCVLIMVFVWSSSVQNTITQAILFFTFQMFAVGSSRISVKESEAKEALTQLNATLNSTRELLDQAARQDERLRISRDLHDVSGHTMTALILKLEYASQVAQNGETQKQVDAALAIAKQLLQDIRSSVSEFRQDNDLDLLEAINKMSESFDQIEFTVDLPESVRFGSYQQIQTLLFCVQEAVTNAIRHGRASRIHISGEHKSDEISISIHNNGKGQESYQPGNGLTGMQERLAALAGTVKVLAAKTGWTIRLCIPERQVFPND